MTKTRLKKQVSKMKERRKKRWAQERDGGGKGVDRRRTFPMQAGLVSHVTGKRLQKDTCPPHPLPSKKRSTDSDFQVFGKCNRQMKPHRWVPLNL